MGGVNQSPRHLSERVRKNRRPRHAHGRLRLSRRKRATVLGDAGESLAPYVETCIEAFGPSRCMFESNFPVDKGSYSYPVFWNACKLLAKGASEANKTDLFSGTATRFYRLPS